MIYTVARRVYSADETTEEQTPLKKGLKLIHPRDRSNFETDILHIPAERCYVWATSVTHPARPPVSKVIRLHVSIGCLLFEPISPGSYFLISSHLRSLFFHSLAFSPIDRVMGKTSRVHDLQLAWSQGDEDGTRRSKGSDPSDDRESPVPQPDHRHALVARTIHKTIAKDQTKSSSLISLPLFSHSFSFSFSCDPSGSLPSQVCGDHHHHHLL